MKIVEGSIVDAKEKYILHQCNCKTTTKKGLSAVMFKKFPFADTYSNDNRVPGTIDIMESKNCDKVIINAYGQKYPGPPKSYERATERLAWFRSCLDKVLLKKEITEVAMSFNIGCGLAGGDWEMYLKELKEFDTKVSVTLYKI